MCPASKVATSKDSRAEASEEPNPIPVIDDERRWLDLGRRAWLLDASKIHRKGTILVSTTGVTANFMFMFFESGTFWVFPLTYFYLPKSARAYLFPRSVKIHYFCSGPISVDPICPH